MLRVVEILMRRQKIQFLFMYVPDPIFCSIPGARNQCDRSSFCNKIGKIGLPFFDSNRKYIMLSMAFLALVSAVLSVIPVLSISHRQLVVMNTAWTIGNVGNNELHFYVGLSTVVVDTNNTMTSYDWESARCTSIDSSNRDYCDQCNVACDSTIRVAIINLLTSIPTITTDLKRSTKKGDLNCQKFMALFTGILGTITTLSSISLFLDGCFRHLPEYDAQGKTIIYTLGPGFICLLIPQVLKPLDVLVNLLTPVEQREERYLSEDHLLDGESLLGDDPTRVEL
jgi:hypothetical protein